MTSKVRNLVTAPLRERVSAEEWEARVNLAACYRLAAHFRMTDLIYTHISARVPGPDHHFLIDAFGQLWDEISASTLVKVTLDGEIVESLDAPLRVPAFKDDVLALDPAEIA